MMQKSTSELLYSHWNRVRGDRPFALRSEINPAEIRSALPFVFILEAIDGSLRFRLAGTHICTVFQRELRDNPFSSIWAFNSVAKAEMLARNLIDTLRPISMSAEIELEQDNHSEASILLLPLSVDGQTCGRLIGALDFGLHRHLDDDRARNGLILTGVGKPFLASGDDDMESRLSPKAQRSSLHAAKPQTVI